MPKRRIPAAKPKRSGAVVLAADCRAAQADELKAALSRMLARAAPVEIQAGAVKQIDAASLQLLVAFIRERQSKGRAVVWREPPAPFAQTAQRLGLAAALGMGAA